MPAATHCRYCKTDLSSLPYHPTRVLCGNSDCKRQYNTEFQHTLRDRNGLNAEGACARVWGSFSIPSKQDALNTAMTGQVMYCPNCGGEMTVTQNQNQSCVQCKALWTVSWGTKANGDVCVARLDRWS